MDSFEEIIDQDEVLTSGSPTGVKIIVSEPTAVGKPIIGHYTYKIKTIDLHGTFITHKRYRQFRQLRQDLSTNWPGIFIPQVPKKDLINKGSKTFLEKRRFLLDEFVKKISTTDFLYNFPIVQDFFKETETQVSDGISYQDILSRYQSAFVQHLNVPITREQIKELHAYVKQFKEIIGQLEVLERIICSASSSFGSFQEVSQNLETLMHQFEGQELNRMGLTHVWTNVVSEQRSINPFLILLNWCRAEILDLQAMSDSIAYLNKLSDTKDILDNQISKLDTDIANAQSGKKTFASFFRKKQSQPELQEKHGQLTAESESVTTLLHIITAYLYFEEVPKFKRQNKDRYKSVVQSFVEVTSGEFQSMITTLSDIMENLNQNF